jgi:glycosyltransferase involved in cell wall biosynthesis
MNKGISIVFGYRNREAERVKKCLDSLAKQTFRDFEVIFIDYGSDENYVKTVKPLVESYAFARYFFNNTRGMPWNRAHALNTGVRLAQNEYILFGDVDLIYSGQVLEALAEKADENTQVYSQVYFLPKGETELAKIMAGSWETLPVSAESGKGGVHLVHKKHLEAIRGYDEYYCFWGVEDRDLYSRLDQAGLESVWIDASQYPVFHQWHPDASGAKKGFFPDRWWESMNIHFSVLKDTLIRNDENWGKLHTDAERKVLRAVEVEFIYKERGDWFYRGIVATELIKRLKSLKEGECLKIIINKNKRSSGRKLKLANTLLNILPGKLILEQNRADRFYPGVDLIYIIWTLIKDEKIISDYAFIENSEEHIVKLMVQ